MAARRKQSLPLWPAVLLLSLSSSWTAHAKTVYRPPHHPPKNLVPMTVVKDAASTGAVCLDGSLPGYHLQRGSGAGADNWLLQFEGGGWCNDLKSCLNRSTTFRGSTTYKPKHKNFRGILNNASSNNPDFYNWNRVKIMYCDGASFGGDTEYHNGSTKLYFRGQRIWTAIIKDLLPKGLGKAKKALLSGCSAGGLATFLHCDDLAHILPSTTIVKCLSDAGFFLDVADIVGNNSIRPYFKGVVTLQNVSTFLNNDCIKSRRSPYECFFPQYTLPNIKQPYFILNSAYDVYQFNHIFVPASADPHKRWHPCKKTLKACTTQELSLLQGFRQKMINALQGLKASKTGGLFINSCYAHCQSEIPEVWYADDSPKIHGKKIAEVIGDWYFERKVAKEIDCPYPCDGTCHVAIQST